MANLYNFQLTERQENRAKKIHDASIIIDMLFQGPLSPNAFSEENSEKIKKATQQYKDFTQVVVKGICYATKLSVNEIPYFKDWWYASGIIAGNRQLITDTPEHLQESMALVTYQFDRLPWLTKVLYAEDIRTAKSMNQKAGIVTAQDTTALGRDLDNLDMLYDFGLRVLQLTYNTQNYVGAGCTERTDAGVTNFGMAFIERMNNIGILVDTGHCGRQTTLDACQISKKPVIASHTAVKRLSGHARCKGDDEIEAIAKTGGVIGIVTIPQFLSNKPGATIEHFLDHVDYIVKLVGVDHVGIGSDWPFSLPGWAMEIMAQELAPTVGFRKGDVLPITETIPGFSDYRDFINITRGLVARDYSDDEIQKILGENWMRVFSKVWK